MNQGKPAPISRYAIDLEPIGRRVQISAGASLLDAARAAGVDLVSLCGGEGWCHSCVVRRVSGELAPPTEAERDALGAEGLQAGERLACQAIPLSDAKVYIPPESFSTPQRLQVEGLEARIEADPLVVPLEISLDPPSLADQRSDATRVKDSVVALGRPAPAMRQPLLAELSTRLRATGWSARLALRGEEVVAALPPGARLMGLAVDVGTTKLAAYLVELASGAVAARAGAMNPQIAYGEDVLSRISYADTHPGGRQVLQTILVAALNGLLDQLRTAAGIAREQVVEAVIVGNTAMHHLLAGLPVHQLGRAPYVPAVSEPIDIPCSDLGLELAPGAYVHLPANVAGYVGADHIAMVLASGLWQSDEVALALDIGTNTEICLAAGGRLWCCSCASGPAFEGAHIQDGMRAAPGAIERVTVSRGAVHTRTIGDQPAVGICGSGILDAVAALAEVGVLDRRGRFRGTHPQVRQDGGTTRFVLTPAQASGHGRDVSITLHDVGEVQLAKAAIRAGAEILLAEAGLAADDISRFVVAGAFGTYLDPASAGRVGMFPAMRNARFEQLGNAAGIGAQQILVSRERRAIAADIARRMAYVELTTCASFPSRYTEALLFAR
jgi:uncharacterized 2Fe-2S/4Fe-4S cluster protein (DUF4445 family)